MAAMVTPAVTALVRLTPVTMQMVKRKLPNSDSRNSSPCVRRGKGASSAGLRSHRSMAMAPMPKRSQASNSTGKMAAKGLDRAT